MTETLWGVPLPDNGLVDFESRAKLAQAIANQGRLLRRFGNNDGVCEKSTIAFSLASDTDILGHILMIWTQTSNTEEFMINLFKRLSFFGIEGYNFFNYSAKRIRSETVDLFSANSVPAFIWFTTVSNQLFEGSPVSHVFCAIPNGRNYAIWDTAWTDRLSFGSSEDLVQRFRFHQTNTDRYRKGIITPFYDNRKK